MPSNTYIASYVLAALIELAMLRCFDCGPVAMKLG